jgi:hypothetical protein
LREQGLREARPADQAAPVAVTVVGLALVLISRSDTSEAWHWIQHGLLFAGGLAAGAATTLLYPAGRRLA